MKILQLLYLLAFVLLIQACDPIELDKLDDDPVFVVEVSFKGETYNISAGIDDNFLLAEGFDPGIFPTPYRGAIGKKDSNGLIDRTFPSLTLKFQQGEQVKNSNSPDHYQSFISGNIPFRTNDTAALPLKEVVFNGSYEGTGMEPIYGWQFGDESSVEFQNPVHAFPELADYATRLIITDDNQCISSTTNTVSFDGRDDCYANISIIGTNSDEAVLEANSSGQAPFVYLWSDGTSANDNLVPISSETTNQEHCVTITDNNGCVSIDCIGIIRNASGEINSCNAQMDESNYIRARTAPQFNSVIIDWSTGEQGEEFFSEELLQPSDARFEILSFEEFEMNDAGQRTVKIEFEMSCMLWETNGVNPQLLEGKGTMAVGLPN